MSEDTYNGDVYREQGTGKVRVKASTHIADLGTELSGSPQDLAAVEAKINAIIAQLTQAGINPDA